MSLIQKWSMGLLGLGAIYLVFTNSDSFYKAAKGFETLTAGSVVAVTTGGKGKATY